MKKIAISFIFVLGLVGCGIKGDPLPPAQEETVQKQSAETATSSSKQEGAATQPATKDAKKKTK